MPTPKTETTPVNPAGETSQVHAWVKAAQSGNRLSFTRLADKYYGAIFRKHMHKQDREMRKQKNKMKQ